MALRKIYSIELNMQQARAALEDATKRVTQLEAQLSGLSEMAVKPQF